MLNSILSIPSQIVTDAARFIKINIFKVPAESLPPVYPEAYYDSFYDLVWGVLSDLWVWHLYSVDPTLPYWANEFSWKFLLQLVSFIAVFSNSGNNRKTMALSLAGFCSLMFACYCWNDYPTLFIQGAARLYIIMLTAGCTLFITYWYPIFHFATNYIFWYILSFAVVRGLILPQKDAIFSIILCGYSSLLWFLIVLIVYWLIKNYKQQKRMKVLEVI